MSSFTVRQLQDPRKFFIAYKKDSGEDLAIHLHDALHNRGVDAFLDSEDIEEGLSVQEWKTQRDNAIKRADVFILIVTHSTCSSEEIQYELRLVRDIGKADIRPFIHSYIWGKKRELIIGLGDQDLDLSMFQIRKFDTKESLLREVTFSIPLTRSISFKKEDFT